MARIVEQLTPMLISINARYKTHAGIRITGLPRRSDPLGVPERERVVLLAGGTGGGKLAAGLQELLGERLTVIANTADDIELHGLLVCPDPDLVTYWLAGVIDEERGWGIRDDEFVVHERLERLGAPGWFALSDRDLATCLYRTHFLAEGGTLTEAPGADRAAARRRRHGAADVRASRSAPGCGPPAGWRGLQEFLILDRGEAPIEGVELTASRPRRRRPRCSRRSRAAEAIVIGAVEPGDLDRADPRVAGDARGDRRGRGAGGRRQPVRRRALGQGADRGVHARRSAGRSAPPGSPPSTRG